MIPLPTVALTVLRRDVIGRDTHGSPLHDFTPAGTFGGHADPSGTSTDEQGRALVVYRVLLPHSAWPMGEGDLLDGHPDGRLVTTSTTRRPPIPNTPDLGHVRVEAVRRA